MRSKHIKKTGNTIKEGHFQALIENAHDAIVVYDSSGRIKYASKSVKKILGFNVREVVGRFGTHFVHPDDIEQTSKSFYALLKKPRKTITLFQRIRHKNGTYIWSEALLTNFSHVPEIRGIVSNFRDITEKKLAEEKIRKTKQLLETITENLSEGIFMGILESKFLYVNEAFLKLAGYKSMNEVLKIKLKDFYVDNKQRQQIVKNLKTSLTLKGVEAWFRKKNGESFLGVINVSLLTNELRADYFVGSIRDITNEKIAEREKIDSRNFLDNIINTVAAPIFVKDINHQWVLVNQEFCNLTGSTKEELIGKSDVDFWPADEAKIFMKIDKQVLRTGKTIVNEEKMTSPNGKLHDLLTVKSVYKNENGTKYIIGFITEITEIKKAQEKIKQLHANLEAVMESANESIFAVDQNLNYTAFNKHHQKVMKELYDADIKIGTNKIQYLQKSKEASWVKSELQKALKGNHYYSEHSLGHPYNGYIQTTYNPIMNDNAKVKGVAVFVQDITQRKQFEATIKSINSNLQAVMESTADGILALDRNYRYITFNQSHAESMRSQFGKSINAGDSVLEALPPSISQITKRENAKAFAGKRFKSHLQLSNKTIFETSYNPIFNDQGKVTGSALFVRDVTESRRTEDRLKAMNEELTNQNFRLAAQEEELKNTLHELSERNFELDQLMYKTSHDLRSPLTSIMGLLNLANLDTDPTNTQLYLDKIKDRINKLDDFINSMLNYARVNRVELEMIPIDLAEVTKNSIKELEYLENFNKVKIVLSVKTNNLVFKTDKLRINIIFSNIISNAYKYYNPASDSFLKIKIEVGVGETKIEFRDNGIGIKPEHINKIFNMFYRATDRSQGSGLGMYIVKQAVEKLNGTISLKSEYGVGTRIKIILPNG
ncbi:MAG TPA: PAS domain S-box protein [Chryseolinea sp.]|nr:PAS domain S-box protein [Chryseolinea sp.]